MTEQQGRRGTDPDDVMQDRGGWLVSLGIYVGGEPLNF